jgi:hypothetical protein
VSSVTDVAGANWSNYVYAFATAAAAKAFAAAYFDGAKHCADGSNVTADTVGDSSFTYTQNEHGGGFAPAIVVVAQVSYLVTIVLDGPNLGTNPPASELTALVLVSVSRLTHATT